MAALGEALILSLKGWIAQFRDLFSQLCIHLLEYMLSNWKINRACKQDSKAKLIRCMLGLE